MTTKKKGWYETWWGVLIIGVITLVIGTPIAEYFKKDREKTAPPIVVTQTQTQLVQPEPGKIDETPKEKPKAHRSKSVPPAPAPAAPQINAPNGIAITGGTVDHPTVNNFGPPPTPPLQVRWNVADQPATPQAPYEKLVTITVNVNMSPVAIGIACDSPVEIERYNSAHGMVNTNVHYGNVDANTVFLYYEGSALTPRDELRVTLKSSQPFSVTKVAQATIKGLND